MWYIMSLIERMGCVFMGQYIFAPAGPRALQSNMLMKCIEYIGSTQAGYGSNRAKGKRYLKYKLSCSGTAINRAMKICLKAKGHDFRTYGVSVYHFHKECCADILEEVIAFIISHSNDDEKKDLLGCVPAVGDYLKLLYGYRLSQLKWVAKEDYKDQGDAAEELYSKFNEITY